MYELGLINEDFEIIRKLLFRSIPRLVTHLTYKQNVQSQVLIVSEITKFVTPRQSL